MVSIFSKLTEGIAGRNYAKDVKNEEMARVRVENEWSQTALARATGATGIADRAANLADSVATKGSSGSGLCLGVYGKIQFVGQRLNADAPLISLSSCPGCARVFCYSGCHGAAVAFDHTDYAINGMQPLITSQVSSQPVWVTTTCCHHFKLIEQVITMNLTLTHAAILVLKYHDVPACIAGEMALNYYNVPRVCHVSIRIS